MEEIITLTRQQTVELFRKWNEESEKNGWDKNPYDAQKQGDYFFDEAKKLESN